MIKFQGRFREVTWMFHESYTEDWRVFSGSFKGVSRKFQGCFIKVSKMFHKSFKDEEVSRKFRRCFMIFKGVSRVFQGSFKKTSKCFKKVSCCMALIAASRAEGGLV